MYIPQSHRASKPASTILSALSHTACSKGLEADFETMNNEVILGKRISWGDNESHFGIGPEDSRRHIYIVGKTGSGKTTLLHNLLIQHIEAGNGIGLIDPHGDLANDLLDYIPSWRTRDVVYLNSADLNYFVGINPLSGVSPDRRHQAASGIVSSFKSLWRDSWGPRLEYILYNAVAALLDCENTTILGIPRMLTDSSYRKWVVQQVRDPFVQSFWVNEYERYDPRFMREAIAPIQNKIGQFLTAPAIRNILGQVKSKIDFRFLIDNQRIFIANLSKGALGEDKANLMGSLLVTQFQLAAMSRTDIPESERRDFFLVIDEFQSLTTDSFASILSEARKFRISIVISNQFLDQLQLPIRQAILANVGTIVSFCIGNTDAETLEKEFGLAYSAEQFTDLKRYEIIVKLLEDGAHLEPFRGKTLPKMGTPSFRREIILEQSRQRYSLKREVIEKKILKWMRSASA